MNQEYAIIEEEKDFIMLDDFNQVLHLIELGRAPMKSSTDASGYTTDGRYVNIELKRRNQTLTDDFKISGVTKQNKTYTASTIYIESHKSADMLFDFVIDKKIPLYINFLEGYVIVHNLSMLKTRPSTTVVKSIKSELYQGFELAKRQELDLSDAWIWKKENNSYQLIRKP